MQKGNGLFMNVTHIYNSEERQQYLIEHHYSIRLKPRLLYAGKQFKAGGWEADEHSHNFAEMVFVYDGHGEVTVGGITRNVSKGDIMPAFFIAKKVLIQVVLKYGLLHMISLK